MEERRNDERRHLVDRRTPQARRDTQERRRRQRRSVNLKTMRNRRRNEDRRAADRRALPDRRALSRRQERRRRVTPSPYSMQDAAAIQRSHTTPRTRPRCPICHGTFDVGAPRQRGRDIIRQVRCASCAKTAIVTNSLKARVIVVAQGEAVRQMIRTILQEDGHDVLEAGDASIGLWAYDQNPADVVFIDVVAPGRMNAGDFVRQLKREHRDARIVAMSGRASYGVADPLVVVKQLGATQTLRMPSSAKEILQALHDARP